MKKRGRGSDGKILKKGGTEDGEQEMGRIFF